MSYGGDTYELQLRLLSARTYRVFFIVLMVRVWKAYLTAP